MKMIFITTLLAFSTSAFANTIAVFSNDEVDAVTANGKTFSVEDLRDGFAAIKGVQVNEESVTVTSESKVIVLLKNSVPNKLFGISTMAAKVGGDMGGG